MSNLLEVRVCDVHLVDGRAEIDFVCYKMDPFRHGVLNLLMDEATVRDLRRLRRRRLAAAPTPTARLWPWTRSQVKALVALYTRIHTTRAYRRGLIRTAFRSGCTREEVAAISHHKQRLVLSRYTDELPPVEAQTQLSVQRRALSQPQ